jgi:hypothetical protein
VADLTEQARGAASKDRLLQADLRELYIKQIKEIKDDWMGDAAFAVFIFSLFAFIKLFHTNGIWIVVHLVISMLIAVTFKVTLEIVAGTERQLSALNDPTIALLHSRMRHKEHSQVLISRIEILIAAMLILCALYLIGLL